MSTEIPKTICMIPWVSVEANSVGQARPCCMYDEVIKNDDGTDLMMQTSSISEAYNSKYMHDLRKAFLAGEKPAPCHKCYSEEAAGRISKRMNTVTRLEHMITDVDYTNLNPDHLIYLDLKLGNICNLSCRVCGSWSSSKLVKEEVSYLPPDQRHLHDAWKYLEMGQWPRRSTTFWPDLKRLLPNVRFMEMTGGEPFLIKKHFELLGYAVEQGYAKDIELHYNTNATIFPKRGPDLWSQFKEVEIAFSIDNLGDRFEFERKGAKWEDTLEVIRQIDEFRAQSTNIQTQICLTVNAQNIYYLPEITDWINEQKFRYQFFNMLHQPYALCIANMTSAAKDLVEKRLQSHEYKNPLHERQIGYLINFMRNAPDGDGIAFRERMKMADNYRGEDFSELYPEIAEAMRYND